jgi:flagellar assembly protein FliH
MDPIIRCATVSPIARRIGRPPEPAPVVKPAVSPAALQHERAPEFALAASDHEAALQQRDAEIDALRAAARSAKAELKDAYIDAERRGYAAGEEKGAKAAGAALQEQTDRIKALVVKIDAGRHDLMGSNEDAMVGIVFAAVCRIVGATGASRETVQTVVRDAIAATRDREQLLVRLHPDDAALIAGETRISADPTVKLGGCIVDSASGSLDARFETQIELLGAALKAARADRQTDMDAA